MSKKYLLVIKFKKPKTPLLLLLFIIFLPSICSIEYFNKSFTAGGTSDSQDFFLRRPNPASEDIYFSNGNSSKKLIIDSSAQAISTFSFDVPETLDSHSPIILLDYSVITFESNRIKWCKGPGGTLCESFSVDDDSNLKLQTANDATIYSFNSIYINGELHILFIFNTEKEVTDNTVSAATCGVLVGIYNTVTKKYLLGINTYYTQSCSKVNKVEVQCHQIGTSINYRVIGIVYSEKLTKSASANVSIEYTVFKFDNSITENGDLTYISNAGSGAYNATSFQHTFSTVIMGFRPLTCFKSEQGFQSRMSCWLIFPVDTENGISSSTNVVVAFNNMDYWTGSIPTFYEFYLGSFDKSFHILFKQVPFDQKKKLDIFVFHMRTTEDSNSKIGYSGQTEIFLDDITGYGKFHAVVSDNYSLLVFASKKNSEGKYEYFYDKFYFSIFKLDDTFDYSLEKIPESVRDDFYHTRRFFWEKNVKSQCSNANNIGSFTPCTENNLVAHMDDCLFSCPEGYYWKKNFIYSREEPNKIDIKCYKDEDLPCWYQTTINGRIFYEEFQYFYINDEGTSICLRDCQNSETNYTKYKNGTYQCLSECPNYFYKEGTKEICIDKCEGDINKINLQTKECFETCPSSLYYYLFEGINYCIEDCKNALGGFNKTDISAKTCLSSCPDFFYEDTSGYTFCTDICDKNKYTIIKNGTKQCLFECSDFYMKDDNGTISCLSDCQNSGTSYTKYKKGTYQCLSECPNYFYKEGTKEICIDKCEGDKNKINLQTKECFETCPSNLYYYLFSGINYCIDDCQNALGGFNKKDISSKICLLSSLDETLQKIKITKVLLNEMEFTPDFVWCDKKRTINKIRVYFNSTFKSDRLSVNNIQRYSPVIKENYIEFTYNTVFTENVEFSFEDYIDKDASGNNIKHSFTIKLLKIDSISPSSVYLGTSSETVSITYNLEIPTITKIKLIDSNSLTEVSGFQVVPTQSTTNRKLYTITLTHDAFTSSGSFFILAKNEKMDVRDEVTKLNVVKCDDLCEVCSGTANNCSSCTESAYLQITNPGSTDKYCTNTCKNGYKKNTATHECEELDINDIPYSLICVNSKCFGPKDNIYLIQGTNLEKLELKFEKSGSAGCSTGTYSLTDNDEFIDTYKSGIDDCSGGSIITLTFNENKNYAKESITFAVEELLGELKYEFSIKYIKISNINPAELIILNDNTEVSITYNYNLDFVTTIKLVPKDSATSQEISKEVSSREGNVIKIKLNKEDNLKGEYQISTIFDSTHSYLDFLSKEEQIITILSKIEIKKVTINEVEFENLEKIVVPHFIKPQKIIVEFNYPIVKGEGSEVLAESSRINLTYDKTIQGTAKGNAVEIDYNYEIIKDETIYIIDNKNYLTSDNPLFFTIHTVNLVEVSPNTIYLGEENKEINITYNKELQNFNSISLLNENSQEIQIPYTRIENTNSYKLTFKKESFQNSGVFTIKAVFMNTKFTLIHKTLTISVNLCSENCRECTGSVNNCLTCKDLGKYRFPSDTSCTYDEVPEGSYIYDPELNILDTCSSDCLYCNLTCRIGISNSETKQIEEIEFPQQISVKTENIKVNDEMTINAYNADEMPETMNTLIDLADCGVTLKENNGIDNIQILSIEKTNSAGDTDFIFQTYNGNDGQKLDLESCNNNKLKTLTSLDKTLNDNSQIFNDICIRDDSKYDMTLKKRREKLDYIQTFCYEGCDYKGVDEKTNRYICECTVSVLIDKNGNNIQNKPKNYPGFLKSIKDTNYEVLKCYKLVFNNKYIKTNAGFYILFILLLGTFTIIGFNYRKAIANFTLSLFKKTNSGENVNVPPIRNTQRVADKIPNQPEYKLPPVKKNRVADIFPIRIPDLVPPSQVEKVDKISMKDISGDEPNEEQHEHEKEEPENEPSENKGSEVFDKKELFKSNQLISFNINQTEDLALPQGKTIPEKTNSKSNIVILDASCTNRNKTSSSNDLEHGDKIAGNFKSLYLEKVKKYNLVLSAIYGGDNYRYLIISSLLFDICTLFFANVFFYNNSYIDHMYDRKNKYDFGYHFGKIVISYLLTVAFGIPFNFLFIYLYIFKYNKSKKGVSNDVIEGNEQSKEEKEKMKQVHRVKIMMIITFVLGILLTIFYWYYAAAFCAVYPHNQGAWIIDSFIGIIISMIVPFIAAAIAVEFKMLGNKFNLKAFEYAEMVIDLI